MGVLIGVFLGCCLFVCFLFFFWNCLFYCSRSCFFGPFAGICGVLRDGDLVGEQMLWFHHSGERGIENGSLSS